MKITIELNDDWIYSLARSTAEDVLAFVQRRRLAVVGPMPLPRGDYRRWHKLQNQLRQFTGVDRAYFLSSVSYLVKTIRKQQMMHPTVEAWLELVKVNDARFGQPTVITRHGPGNFIRKEAA